MTAARGSVGERGVAAGGNIQDSAIATGDGARAFVGGTHFHAAGVPELRPLPIVYNLPSALAHYTPRDDADPLLIGRLLAAAKGGDSAVGLTGMGGVGKTIAATMLVHDSAVRSAFPAGIAWLALGQETDVLTKQAELARALTGVAMAFTTAQEGRGQIGQLLSGLSVPFLLVLDDVWQPEAVQAFVGLGDNTRLLITSRDHRVLERAQASVQNLRLLNESESLSLLRDSTEITAPPAAAEIDAVAQACSGLPLALAATGGMVRRGALTWADVLTALRAAEHDLLETGWLPDPAQSNVAIVLRASIDALTPTARTCFGDFAVLRHDTPVPEAALIQLWAGSAGGPLRAKLAIQDLVDRSLLRRDGARRLSVHALYRDALRHGVSDEGLVVRHRDLLARYGASCPTGWQVGPDDGYFLQHLPWHLHAAAKLAELRAILFDLHWLRRKLAATTPGDAARDCYLLPDEAAAGCLAMALGTSAPILARAPDQLAAQLCGRLVPADGDAVAALLAQVRSRADPAALLPSDDGYLDRPGALVRVLRASEAPILAVAAHPDSRQVLTGGADGALRVWDIDTGEEGQVFRASVAALNAVATLPDGAWAVTAGADGALRIWHLGSGEQRCQAEPDAAPLTTIAVLPDGERAVTGGTDGALRLWDLASGAALRLPRPASIPEGAAIVGFDQGGSYLVTAIAGDVLRAFNLEDGTCLFSFCLPTEEHSYASEFCRIGAIAATSDGRRVVTADASGRFLRHWTLTGPGVLRVCEGAHRWFAALLPPTLGSRVLTAGAVDLRVWDTATGEIIHRHTLPPGRLLIGLYAAPDGRHVTFAADDFEARVETRGERSNRYEFRGNIWIETIDLETRVIKQRLRFRSKKMDVFSYPKLDKRRAALLPLTAPEQFALLSPGLGDWICDLRTGSARHADRSEIGAIASLVRQDAEVAAEQGDSEPAETETPWSDHAIVDVDRRRVTVRADWDRLLVSEEGRETQREYSGRPDGCRACRTPPAERSGQGGGGSTA